MVVVGERVRLAVVPVVLHQELSFLKYSYLSMKNKIAFFV
jgi:hypothetical protein